MFNFQSCKIINLFFLFHGIKLQLVAVADLLIRLLPRGQEEGGARFGFTSSVDSGNKGPGPTYIVSMTVGQASLRQNTADFPTELLHLLCTLQHVAQRGHQKHSLQAPLVTL